MDSNHLNDIDKAFRDRFNGLKDHSIDPTAQWAKFEAGINVPAQAGSFVAGSITSSLGLAASVSGLLGLAVFTTQDKTALPLPELKASSHEVVISDEALSTERAAFVWTEQSTIPTETSNAGIAEDVLAMESNKDESEVQLAVTYQQGAQAERSQVVLDDDQSRLNRDVLDKMTQLSSEIQLLGIEERDIPSIASHDDIVYQPSKSFFVRAGGRIGNGESNTQVAAAKWRLNGLISVGYNFNLSAKSFLSIEAGYLVRSGNGVERSQRIDLDPLFSMITSSNGFSNSPIALPPAAAIDVRESLVATQMAVVHIPALIHVGVGSKSNASIGCFTDYLLSVKNESYMVYSGEDYISTNLDLGTLEAQQGLNKWRLGLIAGYEHSVTDKLSGDVRAMLPITSIYDRSSALYAPKEPNQLVDFQFSLIYKI